MGIAERATEAAAARKREQAATEKAEAERARGQAVSAIMLAGEKLGLAVDPDDVVGVSQHMRHVFTWRTALNDDAQLEITHAQTVAWSAEPAGIRMAVVPADQLYYDLEPGREAREPFTGGVYQAYNLSGMDVSSLADIGERLEKVATARKRWRRKWCRGEGRVK